MVLVAIIAGYILFDSITRWILFVELRRSTSRALSDLGYLAWSSMPLATGTRTRLKAVSAPFCALLGRPEEDLLQSRDWIGDFVHPADQERLRETINSEQSWRSTGYQNRWLHSDGRWIEFTWRGQWLSDGSHWFGAVGATRILDTSGVITDANAA